MHLPIRKTIVTLAAAAAVAAGGGLALASTASTNSVVYHGCVAGTTRVLEHVYSRSNPPACPSGSFAISWNQQGPQGNPGTGATVSAATASQCPNGGVQVTDGSGNTAFACNGKKGATGSPGPATLSVTATTTLTNWPESSGWGIDNFTRTYTVTREHAVPAADCGTAAQQCYFYDASFGDNGTVTTVNGHASPNSSDSGATIAGQWTGPEVGGGKLEFYASTDTPSVSGVPGTADGSNPPSTTTNWYKQFFPAGTLFGLTTGANAPWITYDFNYSVQVTCGTNTVKTQTWNDGINPGDDGQGPSDGDITGTNGC